MCVFRIAVKRIFFFKFSLGHVVSSILREVSPFDIRSKATPQELAEVLCLTFCINLMGDPCEPYLKSTEIVIVIGRVMICLVSYCTKK